MRRFFLIILIIFFMPTVLFADVIKLRNGQIFDGKIVSRNDNKIMIDFEGTNLTFDIDEVGVVNNESLINNSKNIKQDVSNALPGEQGITEQGIAVSSEGIKYANQLLFFLHEQEIAVLMDVIRNGWKDGPADEIIIKYKNEMMKIEKSALLQDFKNNDRIKAIFPDKGALINRKGIDKIICPLLVLLAQAEQAAVKGDTALFQENILTVMDACIVLANRGSMLKLFLYTKLFSFDMLFSVLGRNMHKNLCDKSFLKACAERLKQLMDGHEFVKNYFDESVLTIKDSHAKIEEALIKGEPVRQVMEQYYPGMAVPSDVDKFVFDKEYFKLAYAKRDVLLDKWVVDAKEAVQNNTIIAFDKKIQVEVDSMGERFAADAYTNFQDKMIDGFNFFMIVNNFFISKDINALYFYFAEVKAVYIGILEKLFEIDNNKSISGLSELVPQYADVLPKDDFSESGNDFIFYNTVDDKRVCSVGVDRRNDQGKELLTVENFELKQAGDICFVF
ncbi:MAG: hypothetical protein WCI27_05710 [Candidatus Omnitrophota bacterium]